MRKKLLQEAVFKFLAGLLAVATLLFIPAGTLAFGNAWLFIGLLFGPMLLLGVFLLLKAPELLEKRLKSKEKEDEQKTVIALSLIIFVAGFVLAGLDHRWGWSHLPQWLVMLAAILLLISYALYAEVMRENAYLSRTVEVQQGQKVVDTGLYGLVRHPMYSATILLYLAIPLVLGSLPSFIVFLAYPPLIVKRIRNEEAVLAKGLEGYTDYQQRVKYRLIPFIW